MDTPTIRSAARAPFLAAATLTLLAGCAPATARPAAGQAECSAAVPGALVDVRELDPSIRTEIRYATPNNFTAAPLPGYESPRALLRPEAARALARVQERLRADGFGLKVFDAYRPVRATQAMVAWAQRTRNLWVIRQGYVAERSGHNRGGTVDLTLVRLDSGRELEMGTPYDHFSPAAHTANAEGEVRVNRMRLVRAMEAEGFTNYEKEWWHFGLAGDWEALDVPIHCF